MKILRETVLFFDCSFEVEIKHLKTKFQTDVSPWPPNMGFIAGHHVLPICDSAASICLGRGCSYDR